MSRNQHHLDALEAPILCRPGKLEAKGLQKVGGQWHVTIESDFTLGEAGRSKAKTTKEGFPQIEEVRFTDKPNVIKLRFIKGNLDADNVAKLTNEYRSLLAEKMNHPSGAGLGERRNGRKRNGLSNSPYSRRNQRQL